MKKKQNGLNLTCQIGKSKFLLRVLSQNLETILMLSSSRIHFMTTPFSFIYIYIYIYMPQAADCELLIYANDICLIFQHKGITEIDNGTKQKFLYNL